MDQRAPLCIIPARGGSKRFPHKNIALLRGKPLLAYAIESARESGVFACVCVSSDDDEILTVAREYGADLPLKRSAELASDTVQVKHVCAHILRSLADEGSVYESFALVPPTNPLRTGKEIREAYKIFCEEDANYVMSITPYRYAPQQAVHVPHKYIEPFFGIEHMNTTHPETLYRDDGSVIFAKTKVFLKEMAWYGSKVVPYYMPEGTSVDIDSPADFLWAEFLMERRSSSAPSSHSSTEI